MRGRRHRRRALLLAVCAVVAAGLGLAGSQSHVLRRLELLSVDARFQVRGADGAPRDVLVVGVDATALRHGYRPPIPRRFQAKVVDRLRRDGARVIALDFVFAAPTTARDDNALFAALGRARGTVLVTSIAEHGKSPVLGGARLRASVGARAGVGNFTDRQARGGVIRKIPAAEQGVPSFAVVAAERAGARIDRSRLTGDGAWLDYAGPPGTVGEVSYANVIDGNVDPRKIRGKIVVVGATDPVLADVHDTPTGSMAGPEVNANAIETLLRGIPLRDPSGALAALLILALGLAVPLAAIRLDGLRWLPVPVVLAVVYALSAQVEFDDGTVVPVAAPAMALFLGTAGTIAVAYATDLRDRRRLRAAFGRFVPPQVVDEVVEAAGDELRLGGVRREGTVLFCDLRGFTSVAEHLEPEAVIEILNRYLTEMSDAILDHGGTVVSYMGDGIMAVFGAPLAQEDHADRALAAAREMLGPRLDSFNAAAGGAAPLRMGIGISSGPVMSGNVGSQRRLEYTAVGDTTNTASRLESMTKDAGCPILIADSTRDALKRPEAVELRGLGALAVRGREDSLTAWTFTS